MDWKEISKEWKEQTGPQMKVETWIRENGHGSDLIEKVKERDKKDHRMIRGVVRALTFGTALLTVAVFLNPDPDIMNNYSTRATAAMEILAFTLFIPVGYRKLMEFKSNLTSLSVKEFLDYGEKRFVFWRRDSWVLIPYLLLLGGALNITMLGKYLGGFSWLGFAIINAVYLTSIGVGFIFSWMNYKKKQLPILMKIKEIRQALDK